MLTTLLTIALLAGPASAADHELSLELGSFGTSDDRFDLVNDRATVGTWGVRGGFAVHDRLSVVAGYHRGAWGGWVGVDDGDEAEFRAAYSGHQVLVGPKADLRVTDWFLPYGTVQFAALMGTLRLDEDPDHDDNINQLSAFGFNPGGVAAVGFDLVPIRPRKQLRFGSHLEMGYGLTAATGFKTEPPGGGEKMEIGRFGFGGFYLRWGVGAYF